MTLGVTESISDLYSQPVDRGGVGGGGSYHDDICVCMHAHTNILRRPILTQSHAFIILYTRMRLQKCWSLDLAMLERHRRAW